MLRAFANASADSIYACHVFEHFPVAQQATVLHRWFEILKPGGVLRLSVPDFDKLYTKYTESNRSIPVIQLLLMGGQDYPGNFHCAIFNQDHLSSVLECAGFVNIRNWHPKEEKDWPPDHSWSVDLSINLVGEKPINAADIGG
jgi:predicted SAM-dependent methyltransferase